MKHSSTHWNVRLFGPLEVDRHGVAARFRTKKTASLFAYLALQGERRFSRELLASFFWPESEFDGARQSLRMALSDLRSVLGSEILIADRDSVQLVFDLVHTDLDEFESLRQLAKSSADNQKESLGKALQLIRGELLQGMSEDWITPEWLRLQDHISSAGIAYMALCQESGDFELGVQEGKRLLGLLDFREDIHIGIMRLHAKAGFGSLAIAQFEELELQLDELWGEPPSQASIDVLESVPRGKRMESMPVSTEIRMGKTQLIGRNSVLDELVDDLISASSGLQLTLMGPGGSGKTSVAIECVRRLESHFGDRIWFVDLTAATDKETAVRKLQTILGLATGEISEALPSILRLLRGKPSLLVLDNFEQLLPESAEWVAEVCSGAPDCNLLITSRIALNLDKERRIAIGSLELPTRSMTLSSIRECSSVQLFEREGHSANPRFTVTPDNAIAVVELCNRLDGLPLALELAAARLVTYSTSEILSSIERSIDFLQSAKEGGTPRHSSLSKTIDWSYRLLSPELQRAAMRLALPVGRFSMKTAESICDDPEISRKLEELVSSSILSSETSGKEAQFWMLEILRNYAIEKLEDSEDFPSAIHEFVCHFSYLATDTNRSTLKKRTEKILFLANEVENLLAAAKFGVSNRCATQETAELILNLVELAQVRDFSDQLETLAKDVFSWVPDELEPLQRARLVEAVVRLGGDKRDPEEALGLLVEHESIAMGDRKVWAKFKFRLATLYRALGRYEEAMAECEFVRNELSDINDPDVSAHILYTMALTSSSLENNKKSLDYMYQALNSARKADNPNLLIRCLYDTGAELAHQSRGEDALPLFDEAIELCHLIDSRKLEGLTRWQEGDALLSLSRPEDALQSLQKSIELVLDSGYLAGLKWIFLKTAEALQQLNHTVLAIKLLGKCVTVRIEESRPLAANEQVILDRITSSLRECIGEFKFDRYWHEGISADWDVLVSEVMQVEV